MQKPFAALAALLGGLSLATPVVAQSNPPMGPKAPEVVICLQPENRPRACMPLDRFIQTATLCRKSPQGTILGCRKPKVS